MSTGTVLDKIVASTRLRLERDKAAVSPDEMRWRALASPSRGFGFGKSLREPGMRFICEVKKASPSKGLIAPDFPYLQIAREYQAAGAAAISVLTEPEFFKGSGEYLRQISAAVQTPTLRKDFVVDAYQIYEARALGASAVLLICAILNDGELARLYTLAQELELDALVETHDEAQVKQALAIGANIIGVNNRDLRDFTVDIGTSVRLRGLVPPEVLIVSESGIETAQDIEKLYAAGVDAVLVGETLMRAADKRAALAKLKGNTP